MMSTCSRHRQRSHVTEGCCQQVLDTKIEVAWYSRMLTHRRNDKNHTDETRHILDNFMENTLAMTHPIVYTTQQWFSPGVTRHGSDTAMDCHTHNCVYDTKVDCHTLPVALCHNDT